MKNVIFILLGLVLVSCNDSSVFKELDKDFTDNRWLKSDIREFKFEISDTLQAYDMTLLFSHVAGFQFDLIPIRISMTANDEKYSENFLLRTKDLQGNDSGDCIGDYCDIEQIVFKGLKLAPGNYTVNIGHDFPNDYLPNVLGLGIEIKKSEK
ncbi:MAG: hypothetical protein ITG00_05030 [Flavobacterium sp.]|nr:hypothetical protein [Flavobacterium sp.]